VTKVYKRNANTKCAICGKEIYRRPSEIKKGRVFCNQACYGLANRKEKPCLVCGKPIMSRYNKLTCSRGCANIHRAGIKYKLGRPTRDKVKNYKILKTRLINLRGDKCERCSYGKVEILQVHHKSRKREDNSMGNLELLCPNCHCEEHFLFGKKPI